jgi:hypothetical protein
MEEDPMDAMAVHMTAALLKERDLMSENNNGKTPRDSNDEYESLSDSVPATSLQILMTWGKEITKQWDSLANKEAMKGLRMRCGTESCSADPCRGGIACWSAVDSDAALASRWKSIFHEWGGDGWSSKAKKAVERFLIQNGGGSLPSLPVNLLSKSLTARAQKPSPSNPTLTVWNVFMQRLTDLWTIMGESADSDRRLWLARFHWQTMSAKWSSSMLVDLQVAWTGFALVPAKVQTHFNSSVERARLMYHNPHTHHTHTHTHTFLMETD